MNQSIGVRQNHRPKGTGCVYRRPGSEVCQIKYSWQGRIFRESAHTTEWRKAEKLLARRLAELHAGNFTGPKMERTRMEELAEDFLRDYRINGLRSLPDAEMRWRLHLKPFFGNMRAADVTSTLVAQYVDQRQSQGAKNATINRELSAVRRMFQIGLDATPPKVLRKPKIRMLEENNIRKGFLLGERYSKLVAAVPELWFRALIECGYSYGWRVNEWLNLLVRQVDLADRIIRLEVGETKNNEGREVTMTENVFVLLSACVVGKSPDDHVFTWPDGKPVRDLRGTWWKACRAAGVGALVHRACWQAAGGQGNREEFAVEPDGRCPQCSTITRLRDRKYVGLLFHDLRRTMARDMRAAGVSEGVIMKIGGWKTRSVFERYAIIQRSDVADAMEKLQLRRKQPVAPSEIEQRSVSTRNSAHRPGPAPETGQLEKARALN